MTDRTGNITSGPHGPQSESSNHGADIYQFTPPPPSPEEIAGTAALRRARRRRRLRRTAAGLAVVIGGSTGTAVAALSTGIAGQSPNLASASVTTTTTDSPAATTTPTTTPRKQIMPRPFGRGHLRAGAPGGVFALLAGNNVLHGTYTVKAPSGSYETVQVQTGTATRVSASAIEVKSADGYVQSYSVSSSTLVDANSSGIMSINHGDNVMVQATVSGASTAAQRVVDLTQVGAEAGRWPGGPNPEGPSAGGTGPGGTGPGGATPGDWWPDGGGSAPAA